MDDLWLGIVVGFAAAGVLGFFLSKLRLWRKDWLAMSKPQKGEVVEKGQIQSKKTPWQVIGSGMQAGCLIVMTLMLFGVVLWLLIEPPW